MCRGTGRRAALVLVSALLRWPTRPLAAPGEGRPSAGRNGLFCRFHQRVIGIVPSGCLGSGQRNNRILPNMRLAPATLTALALTTFAPALAIADPVVVELFTSQGCSSCPPADEMFGELAGREDVIALSLHVDYWDWIGWEDTFADPAFSERQLAYSQAAGSNVRYTPQFIINGTARLAGPSGMQLSEVLQSHEATTGDVLSAPGNQVTAAATGTPGQLILVGFLPEARVKILHGENAGNSITYHNIVQSWTVLGVWDGSAQTMTIPDASRGQRQAVLAQAVVEGRPGPILGAVRLD